MGEIDEGEDIIVFDELFECVLLLIGSMIVGHDVG